MDNTDQCIAGTITMDWKYLGIRFMVRITWNNHFQEVHRLTPTYWTKSGKITTVAYAFRLGSTIASKLISADLEHFCNGAPSTTVYYCDPYSFWQKGTIEKNHEYIRYILPKGTSFEI